MLDNGQPINNTELRQHVWAQVSTVDGVVQNVICIVTPPASDAAHEYIHVVSGMGYVFPGDRWDAASGSFEKLADDHKIMSGEMQTAHVMPGSIPTEEELARRAQEALEALEARRARRAQEA
ncbi:hypothetical protein [Desulfovibrio legallii]|mgnify:CR=1 FL=1|uniref:hypothetical protein n=1 Tax=Desulfovibrio legallii TaxID=571438 RepID=UPI000E4EFD35|nr:hypothetical protein [Desulfovibrio legallii]RHH17749.1 hypothetical protein DW219_11590 [Desulfovibrio sp. AM18-2]